MKHQLARALALSASAFALASIPLNAHAEETEEGGGSTVLGIAALYQMKPYGFSEVSPRPLIDLEYGPLSISGSTADLRTPFAGENWEVTLRARYAMGEGYEAADDPSLEGMQDRDGSIWAGVGLNVDLGSFELSGDWLIDAMDNSGGEKARIGLSRDYQAGRWQFTPRASATWMSDDVVDFYYGVTPAEATASRPAYTGSAATNIEIGFRTTYALTPRHLLMLDLSATALGESISDSPIVTDDVLGNVGVGYAFRF